MRTSYMIEEVLTPLQADTLPRHTLPTVKLYTIRDANGIAIAFSQYPEVQQAIVKLFNDYRRMEQEIIDLKNELGDLCHEIACLESDVERLR